MKIYSWNMLFRNLELDRAFDFVAQSEFDIFCLQEVPEAFLDRLRTLDCHLDAAIEMEQTFAGVSSTRYLVTLSRYPLTRITHLPLPHLDELRTWRALLFVNVMVTLRLWGRGTGNRHSQVVDVATPEGIVRVLNLHLPLNTPVNRMHELGLALAERDSEAPTVICGDFNILEHPLITPLTWFLGGAVSDAVRYSRERTQIERHFVEHRLTNALRGKRTHAISRSQLDHILVSHHFSITGAEVVADAYGSDHQPIVAEIKK